MLQVGLDVAYEVHGDRGFVGRRVMALPLLTVTALLRGSGLGTAGARRSAPAVASGDRFALARAPVGRCDCPRHTSVVNVLFDRPEEGEASVVVDYPRYGRRV